MLCFLAFRDKLAVSGHLSYKTVFRFRVLVKKAISLIFTKRKQFIQVEFAA